jgi:hypothetical protein
MERRITSALVCEYFRFKQNSHGYGTSGQTTPGSKRYVAACALQPHPNERARRDSHAPLPLHQATTLRLSRWWPERSPGHQRQALLQARVFLPRKACLRCTMMQPSVSLHIRPGQPFWTVKYMGRASRAGDVGLPDFPDENPM